LKARRWFLPSTPDVLGLLSRQVAVTSDGLDAFAEWAAGDAEAAGAVRAAEPRGDDAKRDVLNALREAFVVPLEPEDVFALSRGVDWILNHARDIVSESEVMACRPDQGIADMAALLAEAVRQIGEAISHLTSDADRATAAADAAIKTERRLERAYYEGMAALLDVEDMRERISRRELYRRMDRLGDTVVDVAERIAYAVVKQS
jgi:uncharacterized protein Yka (UPF0111/DUF47 family)